MCGCDEADGWSVMPLESVPFHALFGIMMWLVIQDPSDPQVRMAGFKDRNVYEAGAKAPMIRRLVPDDFGSEGYGERRKHAIDNHLKIFTAERTDLLWLFDYWRSYSVGLRQYLWVHRESDIERARRVVEILSPHQVLMILRHLVDNYWERFLGWPDLLLHRGDDVLFLEVKSSGDKLSQDQRRWIADNHDRLGLPFKLIKLHRANAKKAD